MNLQKQKLNGHQMSYRIPGASICRQNFQGDPCSIKRKISFPIPVTHSPAIVKPPEFNLVIYLKILRNM